MTLNTKFVSNIYWACFGLAYQLFARRKQKKIHTIIPNAC